MDNPATASNVTLGTRGSEPRTPPLLFQLREYIGEAEASTTTCVSSTTSPVKEYTPDD